MGRVLLPTSFRGRLALLFGLMSLLVGLPAYLYISSVHRAQLISDQCDSLQALAKATATVFAQNLLERRREIELLSRTPLYRDAPLDSAEFPASLDRVQSAYPEYSWIGLADTNGVVRAASSGHLQGVDVSKRPWFSGGRDGVFAGDLHEALLLAKLLDKPEGGQPLRFIDLAAPIYNREGQLRGVLGAHIYWHWASSVMDVVRPRKAAETGLEILIVNKDDHVIFPEREDLQQPVPPALSSANSTPNGFIEWSDGNTYLTAVAAIGEPVAATPLNWRIVVRQPESVVLTGVTGLQRVVLGISVAAAVIFLLLTWAIAGGISLPLERLTEHARRLEAGDEKVTFDLPGGSSELLRLANALQHMAAGLLDGKRTLEAKVAERTLALQQLNERLETLARTDTLTQIANRLAGNERLALEFSRFKRSGSAYTVLIMDIDFFKRVNDTHGHPAGDAVLRHVAALISRSVRRTDFVARVGGEEFMVLLPMTPLAEGLHVAEQIRAAVATNPVEPVGALSISIGAAMVAGNDEEADATVRRADKCLYRAKSEGRNRVVGEAQDNVEPVSPAKARPGNQ